MKIIFPLLFLAMQCVPTYAEESGNATGIRASLLQSLKTKKRAVELTQVQDTHEKFDSALSVSIVFPNTTAYSEQTNLQDQQISSTQHFYVVIANVSDQPFRIYKDDNSWGYHSLYFEITDEHGKVRFLRKKLIGWDHNYPQWWLVEEGKSLVLDVNFSETILPPDFSTPQKAWSDFKFPKKFMMKAVFESNELNTSDKSGSKPLLWYGRTESRQYEVTFFDR